MLAIHPPFLYVGYVGFSVVFSLRRGGAREGRVDAWALGPALDPGGRLLTIGLDMELYELSAGSWWFPARTRSSNYNAARGHSLLHSADTRETALPTLDRLRP